MNFTRYLTIKNLKHTPSGRGTGKWQTKRGLRRYKLYRRRRNLAAGESRRRNRA